MKTIKFFFLFIAATAFAQEEQPTTTDKAKFSWYYGFGITGNNGFNINSNLLEGGVHRIPDVQPAVVFGWTVDFDNKWSLGLEVGGSGLFRTKESRGSQLLQVPARLRGQYQFVNKQMFSVAAGANFSVMGSDLSIWSKDGDVDMNNLDPDQNAGYIRLRNTTYLLGPCATIMLKDTDGPFLMMNMGYDFGIAGSKWRSDYIHVSNPVKEQNNQFYVNLCIPF